MKTTPRFRAALPAVFLASIGFLGSPLAGLGDEAGTPTPPEIQSASSFDAPVVIDRWSRVTDTTKLICGSVPDTSYDTRIKAVRLIGKSIPSSDFETLTEFLNKNPKDDPGTSDELDAIRNDVAGRLLNCDHLPDNFSKKFLALVNAPHVGPVWQNYSVQFLDALWLRETDAGMRKQIYNTLVACTYDTRMTIAGTALITLSRFPAVAGLSKRELGNIAMRLVSDEKIAWQDKVSAIQIAAQSGDMRSLDIARLWAADKKLPVMQRMSALATLGILGDSGTDKSVLDDYSKNGEFRLRTAARAALKKIAGRELLAEAEIRTTDSADKNKG